MKVPYKSVLLSIITQRDLSSTYHTQKYFMSVLLSSKNVASRNLMSLITRKSAF